MNDFLISDDFANPALIKNVLNKLEEHQLCIIDLLFPVNLSETIHLDLLDLDSSEKLVQANIGRADEKKIRFSVRDDRIFWLDESKSEFNLCQNNIFIFLQKLKKTFNQNFYLNLKQIEFHYAIYPPGGHYDKHIDQHKGQSHRIITLIHYLNPSWQSEWGGQLFIYNPKSPDQLLYSVEPKFGRTILFFSDVFPHSVAKSFHTRLSLTGWFRND